MNTGAPSAFADKWLQHEPEMALAEVFVPPAARERHRAWGGLLHELRETAFELSDVRVATVKGGWWAEELAGLGAGRSRHPLTRALVGIDAPWQGIGAALLGRLQDDARPGDTDASLAAVMPLARALAGVEAAVFGHAPGDDAARALAVHLRLQRLPQGLAADDLAGVPMNLLARHGLDAAKLQAGEGGALLRDWARELRARLPAPPSDAALFRRLRTRFDHARLGRIAAGRGFGPPPAPLTVLRAWQVARTTRHATLRPPAPVPPAP